MCNLYPCQPKVLLVSCWKKLLEALRRSRGRGLARWYQLSRSQRHNGVCRYQLDIPDQMSWTWQPEVMMSERQGNGCYLRQIEGMLACVSHQIPKRSQRAETRHSNNS